LLRVTTALCLSGLDDVGCVAPPLQSEKFQNSNAERAKKLQKQKRKGRGSAPDARVAVLD
jgi:hypothetical protein